MRVLLVNTWYYPNMKGGAEQSTKLLAENLAKNGHDVAIYCIDSEVKNNNGIFREIINGVTVFRGNGGDYLKNINKKGYYNKLLCKLNDIYNYRTRKEIKEVILKFGPDVTHTNCINGISLIVWSIMKKNNIPIIHTLRDYALFSPRGILEKKSNRKGIYNIYLKLHKYICKRFSKFVDIATAPSEFTIKAFVENGYFKCAKKKVCVANSVQYSEDDLIKNINIQKCKDKDLIKFLFVGRLLELKGLRHLIQTFRNISDLKLSLIICGDGELKEYVKKEAEVDNRIDYRGELTQEDLKKVYLESDSLIIPSIWDEPFGRVVIEGNSFGLPVIASNKGGIPEIVKIMKSGIVYKANDKESLEKSIRYMSDRKVYSVFQDEIGKNMKYFDIAEQVKKFEELYKEALNL